MIRYNYFWLVKFFLVSFVHWFGNIQDSGQEDYIIPKRKPLTVLVQTYLQSNVLHLSIQINQTVGGQAGLCVSQVLLSLRTRPTSRRMLGLATSSRPPMSGRQHQQTQKNAYAVELCNNHEMISVEAAKLQSCFLQYNVHSELLLPLRLMW